MTFGLVRGGCLLFVVPGVPVVKGRPKFSRGRTYTPARTVAHEQLVAMHANAVWRGLPPMVGALTMHRLFVFDRPKRARKMPHGLVWKDTRPDEDNLSKALADGLVRARVLLDDAQIVHGQVGKVYAAIGVHAQTIVALGPVAAMLALGDLYTPGVVGPHINNDAWSTDKP